MRGLITFAALLLALTPSPAYGLGVNVKDFGAKGDGRTDDTKAIRAAFDSAAKAARSQQYPGSAYYSTSPEVIFPSGHYIITETLSPNADTIRGEGHACIEQRNSDKDVFHAGWAWRLVFSNMIFIAGRTHLDLGNPNIDTGFILIENCKFYVSSGPAIQVRKNSNSTFTLIQNCQFIHCDQVLITHTDGTSMKDCWISGGPKQDNEAMIENRSGKMTLENILGVPNVNGRDQRWIDNYGSLTCRNVRFGGEGSGFTPVVNFAKYSPQLGGPKVILDDCWVSALGNNKRQCALYCEEIPNLIQIRNCNIGGVRPIIVSKQIDPKAYFKAKSGMLRFAFENNVGEFADQAPQMLKKPIVNEVTAGPEGLSDKETQAALKKAENEWLARKKAPESPGSFKGHAQKTNPAEYMELSFSSYKWDVEDYMDGTSDRNSKYIAIAPVGDDILLLRRISARKPNWPHVLVRDVEIRLDRFPYLTWKQKRTDSPAAFAVKVIDKQSGTMLLLEESAFKTDAYRAYNLQNLFKQGGKRTFDIKFYYLGSGFGATAKPEDMLFAGPGDYIVLDFLRAESE